MQERRRAAVPGGRRDLLALGPGGQDALDGPVGRVTGGDRRGAGRLEPGRSCLSASPITPCAERSRYRALLASSSPMTCWQAGPIWAACVRHHTGVHMWNAIFSGG